MNVLLYVVVPHYLFNVFKIYSGIPSFICDIVDLYHLCFYFCQFFLGFTNFIGFSPPEKQFFVSLISPLFSYFSFVDFCSYLYHSFLLLALGLFCSFSSFLRYKVSLLICYVPIFLEQTFNTIDFCSALAASQIF